MRCFGLARRWYRASTSKTSAVGAAACDDRSFCNLSSVVGSKGSGPAASPGRGAYSGVRQYKFVGIGTRQSHRHLDAAHRDADLCADLSSLSLIRAAGGPGEPGVGEAEAAQGADQDIAPKTCQALDLAPVVQSQHSR